MHFGLHYTRFTAQYGRGGHVGTHGPCVRARRMKHKCTIIRADARAVRPYMPLVNNSSYHFANPKVQYSNFNIQSLQILKVKVQCSKFKVKVPTCIQAFPSISPIDNQ